MSAPHPKIHKLVNTQYLGSYDPNSFLFCMYNGLLSERFPENFHPEAVKAAWVRHLWKQSLGELQSYIWVQPFDISNVDLDEVMPDTVICRPNNDIEAATHQVNSWLEDYHINGHFHLYTVEDWCHEIHFQEPKEPRSPMVDKRIDTFQAYRHDKLTDPSAYARADILDTAASCVLQDRNLQAGNPEDNFSTIASFVNTFLRARYGDIRLPNSETKPAPPFFLDPTDIAIIMDFVKTSRIATSPDRKDHWVDKAGYSACGWSCRIIAQQQAAEVLP